MNIEDLPDFSVLREVRDALYEIGEVSGAAVMVGAGFSQFCDRAAATSSTPPLWSHLRDAIVADLYPGKAEHASTDPLVLAQEYCAMKGDHALTKLIRIMVPDLQWSPGPLHRQLLDLPWADVLTTNWDTLLERTAQGDAELQYSVVRVKSEIARARRPRIVKLHGTLPDYKPFIFTEDDFRTYPARFAPFVNLAQQVLLENELCLIGFSGDDPNFLNWAGWVRDQLGEEARPIRLIGVLALSPSRRKLLERRNITPVDLSPLVEGTAIELRHRRATELLLDFMHSGRPAAQPTWERAERKDKAVNKGADPDEQVARIVDELSVSRCRRPNWLITPFYERVIGRGELVGVLSQLQAVVARTTKENRGQVLFEVAWACRAVSLELPRSVEEAMVCLIALGEDSGLEISQRVEVHTAIVRAARRRRDWSAFDRHITALETLDAAGGCREEASYERLLRAKYDLDWEYLTNQYSKLTGTDPIWLLRRAAIAAELFEVEDALATLRQGLDAIRKRRAQDPKSLWLLSREAWASWFAHADFRQGPRSRRDREWPIDYRLANTDPWDEFHRLDAQTEKVAERQRQTTVTRVPQFDAGVFRTQIWDKGKPDTTPWLEVIEMAEIIGIPPSIDHMTLLGDRHARAAELARQTGDIDIRDELWVAAVCDHKYLDKAFSHLAVARLSDATAMDLIEILKRAIGFGRTRLVDLDREQADGWASRVRALIEILSRLAVRTRGDTAIELFRLGSDLLKDARLTHWWLHQCIENLLRRSLTALEPERRKTLALEVLQLPLPIEKITVGTDQNFPEISDRLRPVDWKARDDSPAWNLRISELIVRVSLASDGQSRWFAVLRILKLFESNVLHPDEIRDFGIALWRHREPDSLPSGTQLLPHVFLDLPGESSAVVYTLFEKAVIYPLANGDIKSDRLVSLGSLPFSLTGEHRARRIDQSEALKILHHVINWAPEPEEKRHWYDDEANRIANAIARALAFTVLPSIERSNLKPEQVELIFRRIEDGSLPEILMALPSMARIAPDLVLRIDLAIERGLLSLDPRVVLGALNAVYWAAKYGSRSRGTPSQEIISEVISICRSRRQPHLHWAVECAYLLVEAGLVDAAGQHRLVAAVELLMVSTSYENSDVEALTGVLVRRSALKLAISLNGKGFASERTESWIASSAFDPMPEVRYPLVDTGA